jgi:hypothetical protein
VQCGHIVSKFGQNYQSEDAWLVSIDFWDYAAFVGISRQQSTRAESSARSWKQRKGVLQNCMSTGNSVPLYCTFRRHCSVAFWEFRCLLQDLTSS